MEGLSGVHDTAVSLIEKAAKEDVPTGHTPQKRQWKYVDHWSLAKPREELLGTAPTPAPPIPRISVEQPSQPAQSEESTEALCSRPRLGLSTSTSSEIENRVPGVGEKGEKGEKGESQIPQAKLSTGLPAMAFPKVESKLEEREVPALVESRRRNMSRIRRQ